MAGWTKISGKAVSLPVDNIDTDQIIPARFMSASRDAGYADYLFYDLRRDDDGELSDKFPLNHQSSPRILITGKNFGSGSSREAAVYALVDAGLRAVIAPSFGDIFASNAVNNGLLPARISPENIKAILRELERSGRPMFLDLKNGLVEINQTKFPFSIEENWRTKLINGWDDIDLTLQHAAQIEAFKQKRIQNTRWAWPKSVD